MEDLCEKLLKLIDKPEEYLRPSNKLQKWVKQTRLTYNFIKKEEEKYSLPSSENALHSLKTDGLDTEQIWQLLELQNKSLLASPDDLNGLDDINLCFNVAKLSSLAKYNKLAPEEEKQEEESKNDHENEDSLLSESSDENDDEMESDSEDEDEGMGSLENVEDEEMSENELSDEDIFDNPTEIDGGLNLVFSDDSDKEEDNFDEFIAPEGMEDSDSDDDGDKKVKAQALKKKIKDSSSNTKKKVEESSDEEEKVEKSEIGKHSRTSKSRKFKATEVDSKFFHLRESEWVADNDIIGDNFDMDSVDIDMMKDISDDDEGEGGLMYDGFFDNEEREISKVRSTGTKEEDSDSNEDGDTDDDELNEADKESDNQDEDSLGGDGREVTQLLGLTKKEEKSTFEKERERELMLMSTLEEDNITEKPWFLKGEVVSADRPENSTLEEQLDYNIAARQRPVITEDTTTLVEKIILNRIRSKAWDDVERVVKPNLDPFEYKKKLLLDQDKSKKSLAEIYEEEYLKEQKKDHDSKEEEFPEHTEIREKMDEIFSMLDALANYHYTPTMPSADVKIQSNLPAVTVEEATPVTASDATLLAPQEILAPVRGELRGKSEFTPTDKKRERRIKKSLQKKKAKLQEKKIQESLKKSAGGKKLDTKTTLNVVKKAVKAGQVKMLDGQQNKVVKSSHTFFKQLQENVKVNPKETKVKKSKKNKSGGSLSASKLLL